MVEAHIIAWNEAETIRFTIDHYLRFCERVIIYDNFSTDGTREISESLGAEVKTFGICGELNDKEYKRLKDNCWKGSDADYVIVCDADEILYHPQLDYLLSIGKSSGKTIFKTQGFNIYSNYFPINDWLDIQTGIIDNSYSKLCIFSPRLKEINYVYGCHEANPKGDLVWGDTQLWLLHYRCVGGIERLIQRHNLYKPRLSQINLKWKMGSHYLQEDRQKREDFAERLKRSEILSRVITT